MHLSGKIQDSARSGRQLRLDKAVNGWEIGFRPMATIRFNAFIRPKGEKHNGFAGADEKGSIGGDEGPR
jgi:hypothetical protein